MAAAAMYARCKIRKRIMEGHGEGGALKTVRRAALLWRRPMSRM